MAWRSAISKNLQELRVHLCQKGDASKGARDFVLSQYQHLKKVNPKFPILIRECSGAEARLIARYDFGVEHAVPIDGLDSKTIASKLQDLVKKGEGMPRSSESEGKLAV
ncbi:hypothetical protein ABBQ32_001914 [Trebouxia sp. C0010 RCD-2024]